MLWQFPEKCLNIVTGNFILMMSDEVSDNLCNKKNKTFEICKHVVGGVLGDSGWTGKAGKYFLLDFIIFKFLLTSNLYILVKIMKTCKKN